MNARTRRRTARFATVGLITVLVAGALVAAALRFGETLWALTAPADRFGALVADAEREVAGQGVSARESLETLRPAADAVVPALPPSPARSPSRVRSATPGATVGDGERPPVARVGARVVVPSATPSDPSADVAAGEAEPAVTMEVKGGQTVYRMNGDLVVDPGQQREEPVEVGFEYRFGKRGLEKIKLLEVRQ